LKWLDSGHQLQGHVIDEFKRNNIDYYINFGGVLDDLWLAHVKTFTGI